MWTLFKRELQDTWGFLLTCAVIAGGLIAFAELAQRSNPKFNGAGLYILGYFIVCLFLLALGSARMVLDRNHGISTFFAGHLATRGQVFTVRFFLGILYVILFCIPLLTLFFRQFFLEAQHDWELVDRDLFQRMGWSISTTGWILMITFLLLIPFSCYMIGLKTGQIIGKVIPALGGLCLGFLLLSFIAVKGITPHAVILLILLNLSLIYSSWRQYAAAAL
jgi:hypothetical protein